MAPEDKTSAAVSSAPAEQDANSKTAASSSETTGSKAEVESVRIDESVENKPDSKQGAESGLEASNQSNAEHKDNFDASFSSQTKSKSTAKAVKIEDSIQQTPIVRPEKPDSKQEVESGLAASNQGNVELSSVSLSKDEALTRSGKDTAKTKKENNEAMAENRDISCSGGTEPVSLDQTGGSQPPVPTCPLQILASGLLFYFVFTSLL